jgi:uncharacterized membrane protein YesL
MFKGLLIFGRALGMWWREFMVLILFNLAWLALQLPLITGPAATAAMFAVARRVIDNEIVEPVDGWIAFKRLFIPGLKWGGVNLLIAVALIGNFQLYGAAEGPLWSLLRIAWGIIALIWYTLNLFYWPFWLQQEDQGMRSTLRNCAVMAVKRPVMCLTLAVATISLFGFSIIFAAPLAVGAMAVAALIATLAVDDELNAGRAPVPPEQAG